MAGILFSYYLKSVLIVVDLLRRWPDSPSITLFDEKPLRERFEKAPWGGGEGGAGS